MKKIILLGFIIGAPFVGYSQSLQRNVVCRGDFTYENKILRNSFGERCNEIVGNVRIIENKSIEDLSGFKSIKDIRIFMDSRKT